MRFSDYEANVVFLYRCPLAGLTLWEALQHVEDPNINKPSVTVTVVGVSRPIVEKMVVLMCEMVLAPKSWLHLGTYSWSFSLPLLFFDFYSLLGI